MVDNSEHNKMTCARMMTEPDRCHFLGGSWRPHRTWTGREPSEACLVHLPQPSPLHESLAGCQTVAQRCQRPAGCYRPRPPHPDSHSLCSRRWIKMKRWIFSCDFLLKHNVSPRQPRSHWSHKKQEVQWKTDEKSCKSVVNLWQMAGKLE